MLAIVILASLANADPRLEITNIGSLSKSVNSTTFQIRTNSTVNVPDFTVQFVSNNIIQDANGQQILLQGLPQTITGLNNTNPKTVTVRYDYIPLEFQFELGATYSVNLFASATVDSVAVNDTKTLNFINSYCEAGDTPTSTSNVIIKSISDETTGTGRDEWEWAPLDEIKLEIRVRNDGSDSERIAVKVALALYFEDNEKFIELSGEDEVEDSMRIGDGNSEYFNFNFELPDDVEEGDYSLYVKAYVDGDEDIQCTSKEYDETDYFTEVSISAPADGFMIDDVAVKDPVACGSEETVSFKLYNFDVGDEETFRVGIYNKELGIDLVSNPVELDNGDPAEFSFKVNISKYAAEKSYPFAITVDYDYQESSKIYRETSDDFSFNLNVQGDCLKQLSQNAQMTIQEDQLPEEIKSGQIIKIKSTIKNTATGGAGDEETIYRISVEGAEEFAKVKSISPSTLMLKPGESKDVSITLELNKDIGDEEEKMFNLVASFNGKKITQQLSLTISKYTFWDWVKDHWVLSVLVLIAVLIVLIIAVLVIRNRYY
jgi:hypothetical protein